MKFELSNLEWAIGLFDYPEQSQSCSIFGEFFERTTALLQEIECPPTFIAVNGKGYSGKLIKYGGRDTKRLIDSSFADISVLSIVTNPAGSAEPSFDRYVRASLSFSANKELLFCLTINNAVVPFHGQKFHQVVLDYLRWRAWSFGFGLQDLVARQPDFHVLSLDNGKLSPNESKSLSVWYASQAYDRRKKLRGIYPMMVINKDQLCLRVSPTKTLEDFIKHCGESRIEIVNDLLYWSFPSSLLNVIREKLQGSPIFVGS